MWPLDPAVRASAEKDASSGRRRGERVVLCELVRGTHVTEDLLRGELCSNVAEIGMARRRLLLDGSRAGPNHESICGLLTLRLDAACTKQKKLCAHRFRCLGALEERISECSATEKQVIEE